MSADCEVEDANQPAGDAKTRLTAAPSSATGESSSSLSAGMDEGVSAVNGARGVEEEQEEN